MKSGLLHVSTLLDLAELARQTGASLDEAAMRLDEARRLLDEAGHEGLLHAHWLCKAGHLDLALGRSASPRLEQLSALRARARFTFTTSLRRSVDALNRAQAAFEGGGDAVEQLVRGELLPDVPEAVRRWLVRQGRVTAEQAGLQAESPAASESIPLELGWD